MRVEFRIELDADDDEHAEMLLDLVLLALADAACGDDVVRDAVVFELKLPSSRRRLVCEATPFVKL